MAKLTGRAKGGAALAASMTPKERKARATKAAEARWSGDVKKATHGADDHPLKIGDIEIPCYVLEDETRVLSHRGMVTGMGMAWGSRGSGGGGGVGLAGFLNGSRLSPFVSKELLAVVDNPIRFRHTSGGGIAFGYPATILADLCDLVLAARKAGALQKQQEHIADRCEILVRGFARVGIIALVDEATGFQYDRTRNSLARILEAFVAKELQPWVKTFPDEYYAQLFRLRGLTYAADSVKRPQYFGTLTNDIVYKRLAPGVLDELKKVIPKTEAGRRKAALSQALTKNVGYPKLREHLGATVAYMTVSKDYPDFMEKLNKYRPRYGEQYVLPFDYEPEKDDGKGL
ncbi:P63C domain-containing protein [Tardiphaga sp. OK246]|uniref:P63C domain-containing protein n=1 Tax=Tardiphaga sp. OK246 TaxID=1855307 RepID=UPI000B63AFD2|nr:P63C domain-containing protein [Tardiphaga sp. OK246]SNT37119.1 P63C domain-containing protein [Tardiphaga sp. OK246]